MAEFICDDVQNHRAPYREAINVSKQQQCLRWDRADLDKYYSVTGDLFQSLLICYNDNLSNVTEDHDSAVAFTSSVCGKTAEAL